MAMPTALVMMQIRQWLDRTRSDPDSDAALVRRFAADRDEAAFAALVDRHGPMVLGVAHRIVGDPHTAEVMEEGGTAKIPDLRLAE